MEVLLRGLIDGGEPESIDAGFAQVFDLGGDMIPPVVFLLIDLRAIPEESLHHYCHLG